MVYVLHYDVPIVLIFHVSLRYFFWTQRISFPGKVFRRRFSLPKVCITYGVIIYSVATRDRIKYEEQRSFAVEKFQIDESFVRRCSNSGKERRIETVSEFRLLHFRSTLRAASI